VAENETNEKKGGKQKEEEGENITQYRHRNIYPLMVKKKKEKMKMVKR
jgi:hypothetical protein